MGMKRELEAIDGTLLHRVTGGGDLQGSGPYIPLCAQAKRQPGDSVGTRFEKALQRLAWGCKSNGEHR